MPTPARTSLEEIVSAGRALVRSGGPDGLTMQAVAGAVGVKAPSLYKHVRSRGELVRLITEDVVRDLGEVLEDCVQGDGPGRDLEALIFGFRQFALREPEAYRMVFSPMADEGRPSRELLAAAIAPVLRATTDLVGPDRALDAARLVTAWAHGFMTMELAGAFRLEGSVEGAFSFGAERIVASLEKL